MATELKTVLVILQNAYRKNGRAFSKKQYLEALWHSRTGIILTSMLPGTCRIEIANASPKVGHTAKDIFRPDPAHILDTIGHIKPDVILGCGAMTQHALKQLQVPFVPSPHPAWRAFTKRMRLEIKTKLEEALQEQPNANI